MAGVLTFAHGVILVVLAVLEALDVKVGVLVYAQLFEATMAVEFLVELRSGESTLVYPITLVSTRFFLLVVVTFGNHATSWPLLVCHIFYSEYQEQ